MTETDRKREGRHRTQAMPDDGKRPIPQTTNAQPKTAGQSAGGPYPNPHGGRRESPEASPGKWHGGQSDAGYYGPEQLGEKEIQPGGNPNAGASR